ncbi:MAG: biotin transporter BioY [Deltaproteobacteria bacterium]|nr:MAG: biotin transporter BioY [Deltaproteobacteria bacterium]
MSARELSLVALFAALTGIGGFIRVPIPYVPLTLQTLMVMFSGLILGSRLAPFSQLVYILVGLMGLPIFAHGGGPGYVLQPTFGYLLGFILGAYVIGWLTGRREPLSRAFLFIALVAGVLAIYLPGVTVLYLNLNFVQEKAVTLNTAIKLGFLLPLPGDLLKMAVVLYFGPLLHQRLRVTQADLVR